MGTVILGTGSYLPEKIMSNKDFEKIVETSDEWIRSRTGIHARRIAGKDEFVYKIASYAAQQALDAAGISADAIDLLILGTISSHMLMPSSACFVQNEIGAKNAFAFDLNAACSGFLYSLDIADKYVQADPNKKVLVIGAETLSNRLNWQDRNTCILFGDGAGAAVVGFAENRGGYCGAKLFSDGSLSELLYMHGPESTNSELRVPGNCGAHIVMEGREVFKYAVRAMTGAICSLLDEQQMTMDDVSLVVPHQANVRILKKLQEKLAIPNEKLFCNVSQYGNTSAASIPIALDEAYRQGRIAVGDNILFSSFGGGFTWGATLLTW